MWLMFLVSMSRAKNIKSVLLDITTSIRNEAAHAALKQPVPHAYAISSLLELELMDGR